MAMQHVHLLALFVFIFAVSCDDAAGSYRRVCYFRYPTKLNGSLIDPHICTHINFAFLSVKDCHLVPQHPGDPSGYKQLHGIKKINPNIKLLFSVGGGGNPGGFHSVVANHQNRTRFIKQSVSFIKKYNFDGLDFDWEFPSGGDVQLFPILLKEFREYIRSSNESFVQSLLLSAAVSSSPSLYNVPMMAQNLDFVNIMTYDFNSYDSNHKTSYNSPLYAEIMEVGPQRTRNTNYSVHSWMKRGIASTKLNVGLPTYGRAFLLANPAKHGFHAPAVGDAGTPMYPQICKLLKLGAHSVFDNSSKVPYLFVEKKWISYPDVNSFTVKSKYIKANNLGGSMTWVLDSDDFAGTCGQGKFPLHKVLAAILSH